MLRTLNHSDWKFTLEAVTTSYDFPYISSLINSEVLIISRIDVKRGFSLVLWCWRLGVS